MFVSLYQSFLLVEVYMCVGYVRNHFKWTRKTPISTTYMSLRVAPRGGGVINQLTGSFLKSSRLWRLLGRLMRSSNSPYLSPLDVRGSLRAKNPQTPDTEGHLGNSIVTRLQRVSVMDWLVGRSMVIACNQQPFFFTNGPHSLAMTFVVAW